MSQINIENGNTLALDGLRISFQRTLRIPDDGKTYPLPPGLGAFPLRRVADYLDRVPEDWRSHGGVFLPMYQCEAMWLRFSGPRRALKVGVGKVCAISGKKWKKGLKKKAQNYVVAGVQPWLDGIASGKGTIKQFVAMPLGSGYTVEAQVTGDETHGGIQLAAYPPKPGRIPTPRARLMRAASPIAPGAAAPMAPPGAAPPMAACPAPAAASMGLAAGGTMKQKIYPDPHGVDVWDLTAETRVFVHLANSALWTQITGEAPPPTPVTAKAYSQAGLPWFDLYDDDKSTLKPSKALKNVKSVAELDQQKTALPLKDESLHVGHVTKIQQVQDGDW